MPGQDRYLRRAKDVGAKVWDSKWDCCHSESSRCYRGLRVEMLITHRDRKARGEELRAGKANRASEESDCGQWHRAVVGA